jgi:heme-degrading monooxygenase HmoA
MICRFWRGWTTKEDADAYERLVREQVISGIEARRIPGFLAFDFLRRERDDDAEFVTLMWFETLESVQGFAGDEYELAHVPAEARALLADFDRRPAHYEVLDRRDQPR